MHKKIKGKKPDAKFETIFETEARLKEEAKQIARTFNHTKPIKYLLK